MTRVEPLRTLMFVANLRHASCLDAKTQNNSGSATPLSYLTLGTRETRTSGARVVRQTQELDRAGQMV